MKKICSAKMLFGLFFIILGLYIQYNSSFFSEVILKTSVYNITIQDAFLNRLILIVNGGFLFFVGLIISCLSLFFENK